MMVLSGAFMLLAASTITSCVDDNDWNTNPEYDRLFSPTSLSVTAQTTSAELTWKSSPGTKYYVVELSTDSLYGKTEEVRPTSLVYGQDGSVTKSPFVVENLNSNSKYFVRVMACSDASANSNWSYLEKFSFSTKAENILNAVSPADKGEDFINLSWEPGMAVTSVVYAEILGSDESGTPSLGETMTIDLTSENIEEGKVTITGLKASTGYVITILNGEHARGTRTVTTRMQLPEADVKLYINIGETLTQDMLNEHKDKGSVTVCFQDGGEYDIVGVDAVTGEDAGLTIPSGMSITFFGNEGESKAVLNLKREIILGGIHAYVRFDNVIAQDGDAQYMFNQGIAASVTEMSFNNCEFNNFARSIIRFKDQKSITVDNMTFEDCVVTNQGKGNYAMISLDAKEYTVNNMTFNNTIFNGLQHNVILLYNSGRGLAAVDAVEFNNCTLYNYIGGTRYLLDAGSTSNGPTLKLNNSILAKTFGATVADGVWTSTSKGARTKEVIANNSYNTVDGVFGSNAIKGLTSYSGDSNALFTNPAEGDFSIKDGSFPSGVGASFE